VSERDTSAAELTPAAASFYTRQATGLVRDISVGSNIALNVSFVSLPLAALVATEAPFSFPGADPFWVTAICVVLCIIPTLLYGMLTKVMPRSGGDYVFVSRTMHPWIGFAANFNISAWYLLVIAYFGYLLAPLGFSPAFTTLGVATHNSTFLQWGATLGTSKPWGFAIGAIILGLCALLMSLSLRRALRIFGVVFLFSLLSVVLSIIVLSIHGRSDFVSAVSQFGGNYNKILADAHRAGFAGSAHFSFKNTVLAMPLAFASFGYAIVSAYAGGEVRSARTRALRGMLYSLAISGVLVALLMALASHTFGNDFLGSATYLSNTGSKLYPFGSPAFFFFFVSMVAKNPVLIALINFSYIAAYIVALPATFLIVSRNLFAWSFDRVLPDKVAEVNPKTHSPVVANVIILIATLLYLVLIIWGTTGFLEIFYTAGLAEILTFFVVALTGIVFPFVRRELYERSPIRGSVWGIPTISLIGIAALLIYALFWYPLATNNVLGANTTLGWVITGVIAGVGIVAYPVSYLLNRARGIDLGLAFKQLPPE
jgi:amino acid transporter